MTPATEISANTRAPVCHHVECRGSSSTASSSCSATGVKRSLAASAVAFWVSLPGVSVAAMVVSTGEGGGEDDAGATDRSIPDGSTICVSVFASSLGSFADGGAALDDEGAWLNGDSTSASSVFNRSESA